MFNKARMTVNQCKKDSFIQYKYGGGENEHWRFEIEIFFDNHGNNTADYVLYHKSLPRGYRSQYDTLFTNADDLARCIDRLFFNWRSEELIYTNHEKAFLHREIQSFLLRSFKDVEVEYFTAKSRKVSTKQAAQGKGKK